MVGRSGEEHIRCLYLEKNNVGISHKLTDCSEFWKTPQELVGRTPPVAACNAMALLLPNRAHTVPLRTEFGVSL
eukprot:gene22557-biopygen5762